MSDIVIQAEDLSKYYRLGVIGGKRLVDDFARHWARLRGKEDPLAKIGSSPKGKNGASNGHDAEGLWALKDVSFEIKQGDVVGVIGRNGAGKSTLLKLLSRVTAPTTGEVRMKGRIASLLEVGTGFHPELTGRENIFLNGAILGMTKAEIRSRFDEIVEFSGVEQFINTPVKRYSSGMYVRLAFAVAAHLEPEILIIDEVLAVGDAQFQKKCIGKMRDVAGTGRTVLFVSHNMTAIRSLCSRGLLIRNGGIATDGSTEEAVFKYVSEDFSTSLERQWEKNEAPEGGGIKVVEARLIPENAVTGRLTVEDSFELAFHLLAEESTEANISLHFMTPGGEIGFAVASPVAKLDRGETVFRCSVPGNFLNDGNYSIEMLVVKDARPAVIVKDVLNFEIDDCARTGAWMGKWPGFVRPNLDWDLSHVRAGANA